MNQGRRKPIHRISNLSFSQLERRQFLATLFLGTSDADTASIEYAGENLVDIRINDALYENVDSSDGIPINLVQDQSTGTFTQNSSQIRDTITIDHRIADPVFVHNSDEIVIDGVDNVVHAFTAPDSANLSGHALTMSGLLSATARSVINFNSAIEVVRVNGSSTRQNVFVVDRNTDAKLIVAGSTNRAVQDQLAITFNGELVPDSALSFSPDDPKKGSAKSSLRTGGVVFFEDIEIPSFPIANITDGSSLSDTVDIF